MRVFRRFWGRWPTLLVVAATLGALALSWYVHDTPAQPHAALRVDALSAFFIFATLAGLALIVLAAPIGADREGRVPADAGLIYRAVAIGMLVVAYSTTLLPMIAGAYVLLALLTLPPRPRSSPIPPPIDWRRLPSSLGRALRHTVAAAPGLLAAACLAIGYGTLALRGGLRYDDRLAGAALDSFVFWFVLLAAVIPISALALQPTTDDRRPTTDDRRPTTDDRRPTRMEVAPFHPFTPSPLHPLSSSADRVDDLLRIAWLYPLVRLYSLGPWNDGWSFATLLLGGAVAAWSAISALTDPREPVRGARIVLSYLGLTLAGLGLGTSAGIAAGCYGMLAYLALIQWPSARPLPGFQGGLETGAPAAGGRAAALAWLISGAVPLTAPFVAAWMLVGAAAAGGVTLLAGVAWLVTLLNALTTATTGASGRHGTQRSLAIGAATSVALGVGSAPVVRWLIAPVVAQLQGGLTPYGDINVWPWVGLAASDSAHRQVTTLPSLAVAALMLVLSALVYLVWRLRIPDAQVSGGGAVENGPAGSRSLGALIRHLRAEVPWLGGPDPHDEERPVDGK